MLAVEEKSLYYAQKHNLHDYNQSIEIIHIIPSKTLIVLISLLGCLFLLYFQ